MASRVMWLVVAGLALIGGILLQDGNSIFSWDDEAEQSRSVGQRIETGVEAAIDRSFDQMEVVNTDGQEVAVSPESKRALADAIRRLVEAESDVALLKIRDASGQEIEAASVKRDQARADLEILKAKIEGQKAIADEGRAAVRDEVRQEVRETVRDAVRN